MAGIILLVILVPLAIIILLIAILNKNSEQQRLLESLYDRMKHLSNDISALAREIKKEKNQQDKPVVHEQPEIKHTPLQEVKKPEPVILPEINPRPVELIPEVKKQEPPADVKKPAPEIIREVKKISTSVKETDLEKFIGENLANKIGIAVLVLGISFFVKYAIDKDWIKETGRVITGLITGGVLIGIAHRIRNSYRSFSSVLVGGGLTVFYFTIAFAFHQYHLISQPAAFFIMIVITAFAVLLSLYYDRLELAVLATLGGFLTPFLVSTGQDNYVALFTYLCILCTGLMVLSWFKRWAVINIIALVFTTIIYGGWLIKKLWFESPGNLPYKDALFFGILFYLLFVAMNIINNVRLRKNFNAFDFIIVLSINFLFFLAGFFILRHWNDGDYNGLFTVSLGLFNLLLVLFFRRKKSIDANFIALLTGLSITFISLAAPVEFEANHVVLFWAAEAVLLFRLYQRTRINQLKVASFAVSVLMLVSLLITWLNVYYSGMEKIPLFLNKGFTTSMAAAGSIFIYFRLMYKEADTFYLSRFTNHAVRNFLLFTCTVILYTGGALEIFVQFSTRYSIDSLYSIYLQAYTFLFALLVLWIFRKHSANLFWKLLLPLLCFGYFILNMDVNYSVALTLISDNKPALFIAQWAGALLLVWLLSDLVKHLRTLQSPEWVSYKTPFTWFSSLALVVVFSLELYLVNLWMHFSNGTDWTWWENLYYKAGLSILWSICSFAMMWQGMRHQYRPLRIISLSLFTLTLLKLFIYDIRNIPPGGKIAAFILLGVLLLIVSFMYQRLKKIIIDDTEKPGQ
jgi:uncharacterized membrane protein